jgi:hypothetical protein
VTGPQGRGWATRIPAASQDSNPRPPAAEVIDPSAAAASPAAEAETESGPVCVLVVRRNKMEI